MPVGPPEFVFLGLTVGEWPIVAFESETHATHWLSGGDDGRRHLYRCKVEVEDRYVLVPPTPASIRPVEEPA